MNLVRKLDSYIHILKSVRSFVFSSGKILCPGNKNNVSESNNKTGHMARYFGKNLCEYLSITKLIVPNKRPIKRNPKLSAYPNRNRNNMNSISPRYRTKLIRWEDVPSKVGYKGVTTQPIPRFLMKEPTLLKQKLTLFLPIHQARITFIAQFVLALLNAQTSNLTLLAQKFKGKAKVSWIRLRGDPCQRTPESWKAFCSSCSCSLLVYFIWRSSCLAEENSREKAWTFGQECLS